MKNAKWWTFIILTVNFEVLLLMKQMKNEKQNKSCTSRLGLMGTTQFNQPVNFQVSSFKFMFQISSSLASRHSYPPDFIYWHCPCKHNLHKQELNGGFNLKALSLLSPFKLPKGPPNIGTTIKINPRNQKSFRFYALDLPNINVLKKQS